MSSISSASFQHQSAKVFQPQSAPAQVVKDPTGCSHNNLGPAFEGR